MRFDKTFYTIECCAPNNSGDNAEEDDFESCENIFDLIKKLINYQQYYENIKFPKIKKINLNNDENITYESFKNDLIKNFNISEHWENWFLTLIKNQTIDSMINDINNKIIIYYEDEWIELRTSLDFDKKVLMYIKKNYIVYN